MIKFSIGFVFGFSISFVVFLSYSTSGRIFNVNEVMSSIIALSSVVAVIIHYHTTREAKKIRIWDANKVLLLDLKSSLKDVIKASEYYLQEEEARHYINDPPSPDNAPAGDVYSVYDNKVDVALEVYGALMGDRLVAALGRAKEKEEGVRIGVMQYDVDNIQAYEESICIYKWLSNELDVFIAKMSGVK